jgi:hypothetical protein
MSSKREKGKSSPEAILDWFQNLYCAAKKGTKEEFKKAIVEWHNDHPKEYKTTDDELRQELYDYATKGKVNSKIEEMDYRNIFIKAIKEEATFMKFLEGKCKGAMRPLQKGTIKAALTIKKNKKIKENNNMGFEDKLWESIEEISEIVAEVRPSQSPDQADAVYGPGARDYREVKQRDPNIEFVIKYVRTKRPDIYKQIGSTDDPKNWDIAAAADGKSYFINSEDGQRILTVQVNKGVVTEVK